MALNTGDVPYAVISAVGAANPEQQLIIEFTVRDETGQVNAAFVADAIRSALTDSGAVTNIVATRYTATATEI